MALVAHNSNMCALLGLLQPSHLLQPQADCDTVMVGCLAFCIRGAFCRFLVALNLHQVYWQSWYMSSKAIA